MIQVTNDISKKHVGDHRYHKILYVFAFPDKYNFISFKYYYKDQ